MPARRRRASGRSYVRIDRPLRAGGMTAPDVRCRFGVAQRLDSAPVAFVGLEGVQHQPGAHPAGRERDRGDSVGA